jgi:hypothetical protein
MDASININNKHKEKIDSNEQNIIFNKNIFKDYNRNSKVFYNNILKIYKF